MLSTNNAVFNQPIPIEPNVQYEVRIDNVQNLNSYNPKFLTTVELRDGSQINFTNDYGPVSWMVFQNHRN